MTTLSPSVLSPSLLAVSTIELTLRMMVALLVILAILYVSTRVARRRLGPGRADGPAIDVAFQRPLTKHATLSLIKAGDRNLLIASNNQSITLLAEGDDLVSTPDPTPERTPGRTVSRVGRSRESTGNEASIDIRSNPVANPIRALQNRTVRRG